MREYIPQWIESAASPQTPSDGTDKTDKNPSVSCDSGPHSEFERITPEDAENLKAAIVAAVTVDPAKFDRAEYDRLTALWNAYVEMARRDQLGTPHGQRRHGTHALCDEAIVYQTPDPAAS